ncbi:MAG: hypothetical protein E6Q80_08630 [Thauera aminoaromatica]|uniref:YjbF family lipoprotein n=1 Tax=Thauera aminoaromatica TaxID=164330 RepID=A0A5C7SQ36_THASP|nr:MAG: hypothetical protein E6Q80_08630 [Thauera aminoaromatica]
MSRALPERLAVLAILACAACSTDSTNISRTFELAYRGGSLADRAAPNPAYRYLRTVVDGRSALLVLGYTDPDPATPDAPPIEVWYSAEGEVVRLQQGRVVGTSGLSTDWRSTRAPDAPTWGSLVASAAQDRAAGQALATWQRTRDESAYRSGVIDRISVHAIAAPRGTELAGLAPESLQWFEERAEPIVPPAGTPGAVRLTARYALRVDSGATEVVYTEHCLGPELCLSLQRWPAR